ncbi:hypothetical protein R84B8_01268 [Treponema sp. R8-4-B8]
MADTGGRRNEKPLTDEQFNQAKEYAVSLGMPEGDVLYDQDTPTCYAFGTLVIGTDIVPLSKRSTHPNDNISIRGGIAHEVVGHREAELKGRSQPTKPMEEAQASIRAARFAPGLSRGERIDLIRDGINRLHNAKCSLRDIKNTLFINER